MTFGSSLPPFVCRRTHVLLMLFVLNAHSGVQLVLTIWVTWRVSYKRQELHSHHEHLSSSAMFWWGSCCSHFLLIFCVFLVCVFTFWVPCCDVRYDFRIKTMFRSSLLPVVCKRAHVIFTLYVIVFVQWCPTHIVLHFCFAFLRLV